MPAAVQGGLGISEPRFWLQIITSSGVPLYVQLKEQLKRAIGGGVFAPGDRLPTVRELATDAVVNPNTVARVYRELEAEGYIAAQRGVGTFVAADPGPRLGPAEREAALAAAADRFLVETGQLGLTAAEAAAYLAAKAGAAGGQGSQRGQGPRGPERPDEPERPEKPGGPREE